MLDVTTEDEILDSDSTEQLRELEKKKSNSLIIPYDSSVDPKDSEVTAANANDEEKNANHEDSSQSDAEPDHFFSRVSRLSQLHLRTFQDIPEEKLIKYDPNKVGCQRMLRQRKYSYPYWINNSYKKKYVYLFEHPYTKVMGRNRRSSAVASRTFKSAKFDCPGPRF